MSGVKTPEFILTLLSIFGIFILQLVGEDVTIFIGGTAAIVGTFNISRGLVKKDTVHVLGPAPEK